MTQDEVLHSPFDIETHKKTFVNYLEAVITSDGAIHYAIPSHDEWCIRYVLATACFKDREELYEYLSKTNQDIEQLAHCCLVWTEHVRGYVNNAILQSLQDLIENKLLHI